ncbi:MAG: D-alanyl-D-alanine carboxypeptidase, partial [Clostridia bacterium]|nr:D-alanyl-D-alanine carboxypeptidase [Clostridia bacterium]
MYKTYLQKWLVLPIVIALLSAMMPTSVAAATPAVEVQSSASSAVLYEPTSGRVLFEKQAHVKRPMASTTKLMTALLAAELLSPTAMLTASEDALRVEGSSMGLSVGDVVSRDDLLRGLLLSSGNDAANVLALSMAESFEAFACVMNARAALIGMSNSHFVTPSGLDAEGHGSTAYDMALLAAEVLKNETLASICSAQSAFVTVGDRQFALTNHNKLLA